MKHFKRTAAVLVILALLCSWALAEEIVCDAVEPQVEEIACDAVEAQVEEIELALDGEEIEPEEPAPDEPAEVIDVPPAEDVSKEETAPEELIGEEIEPGEPALDEPVEVIDVPPAKDVTKEETAPEEQIGEVVDPGEMPENVPAPDVTEEPPPEPVETELPAEESIPGPEPIPETEPVPVVAETPAPLVPKVETNALPRNPGPVDLGLKEKRRLTGFEGVKGATYVSSAPKVVSVSADGVVKGKKRGVTTVTVSTPDGQRCDVSVRVFAAPKKLRLSAKKLALEVGEGAQLAVGLGKNRAGAVGFTSSDPGVARVDGSGRITAVGPGSAKIVVRSYNGKKAKCKVRVVVPAASIALPSEIHIAVGEKAAFGYRVTDANGAAYAGPVSATLAPKGIAAFKKGRLIGKQGGAATFTVRAGKLSKSCKVVVEAYASAHPVKSVAHRGSAHWPENTLEAFRNFPSTGADGVELDARSTSDGVQVIFHDPDFTAGGTRYVLIKRTYAELKAANPSICTLDEALKTIKATGKSVHLELKSTADGAKCVHAVNALGMASRTVYFSFYTTPLRQVRAANPSATLGLSLKAGAKPYSKGLLRKAKRLNISFFVAHKSTMDPKVVDYWHRRGFKISVWTVNDMPTVQRLCDMGVDYILSDYPEYCVQARGHK